MSKIDYVIREGGSSNLISAESEFDFLITEDILKNYPYILDSMDKEEYYIENEFCSFFDELIFENKVVGFATYNTRNDKVLLLTECFILPEFRGNRVFFYELCKMIFVGPEFGILQPTRDIVELLLRYSFAKDISENIVVSAIEFYFDDFDARSNKNSEFDEDKMPASNLYDLSINSTIFVDGDEIIYHDLLENDLRKHGKRKELTKDYFKNIKEFFEANDDEINDLISQLKDELPQVEFGFNEVVGRGEGLSEFMQAMVDDDLISYEEALAIKDQLTKEYDSGEITDGNVDERLVSLLTQNQLLFSDFKEFKDVLDDEDIDDEDANVIKDFFDIIGDNEELGNDILQAVLTDNQEAFSNIILNAMGDDEKFMDDFLDLANECGDGAQDIFIDDYPQYKLDDTEYGKDYPVSYDMDIYHILDAMDNVNNDFEMMFIQMELSSNNWLSSLMLSSGLIKIEGVDIDWINRASEFKKDELKEILRENGLKVSGNKKELLKRLADNNVTYGESFKITQKGKNYLNEFSWIQYYEEFLDEFDFNDFYRYLDNHEGKLKDISLMYLDEHIALARQNEDMEYLENCIISKKIISDKADEFLSDLNNSE